MYSPITTGLPRDLLTSLNPGTRRVRVDVGQTGFWEGREFRVRHIVTGPYVIRVSSPIDFILQLQSMTSNNGTLTFSAYRSAQGTPGGTFDQEIHTLPNNGMSTAPAYTQQVSFLGGGTFTPGVDEDPAEYVKIISSTATAQRTTVGGGSIKERGLPAGDYYLVFTGTDGQWDLVYEERP